VLLLTTATAPRRAATPPLDLAPRLFEGPVTPRTPRAPRQQRPRRPRAPERIRPVRRSLPHGARVALALATVYLIWGSTFLATGVAVAAIPPFLMLATRFLLAGGALFVVGLLHARRSPTWVRPTWQQWRAATVTGMVLLVGGTGLISASQVHLGSGIAALLTATVPLWMALVARLRFGDQLSWRAWVGLVVGLVGVGGLVDPSSGQLWPMLMVIAGAISWAVGTLRSRTAEVHTAPLVASAMEMLGAGAGFLVVGVLTGEHVGFVLADVDRGAVWAFVYLVTAGSIVAFTAYRWLMDNVSTVLLGSHGYINPTVAVFFGWALAGEAITSRTLVGGAVVLVSVVLLVTGRPDQPVPAQATSGGDVFAGQSRWHRARRKVGRLPSAARLYVQPGALTSRPSRRDELSRDHLAAPRTVTDPTAPDHLEPRP
jgi:drug/metabolite transporter (DMT)-like permease